MTKSCDSTCVCRYQSLSGENMTSKRHRLLPRERETFAYQLKGFSTADASTSQSESRVSQSELGVSHIDRNLCEFYHLSSWRSALDERCLNQYSLNEMRFVPSRVVPAAKKSKPNVGDPSDHQVSKSEGLPGTLRLKTPARHLQRSCQPLGSSSLMDRRIPIDSLRRRKDDDGDERRR
eukprot:m.259330 g.259330  ORF g.259330 m.259330 type:complete len:178 (+) comp40416_c0_seq6:521-1054(+)